MTTGKRQPLYGTEPGWWHPPTCANFHDDDGNCLDDDGSITGWPEPQVRAEPPALDVERLAKAMRTIGGPPMHMDWWLEEAERIAAEYARLARESA
jgi:hypothetical protein